MRAITMLISLLLVFAAPAQADGPHRLMEQFRQAFQQRNSTAVAALFAPDASVKVTLLMEQEAPMVVSLSRAEYLQQQRALWNFASDYSFTVGDLETQQVTQGWQLTFNQKERYRLFQGTLNRDNRITLQTEIRDGKSVITAIHTRTRQW
ncbi:MAG: hypothetical protein ACFE0K_08295 [Alcanivorax sp.]|uniref:hypothetical protein n=1 Tax=Alcanivorax sp. TaxID=1872427 RepID=UPI003DA6F5EA